MTVNRFSGAKYGAVRTRYVRVVIERIKRARETEGGIDCIGIWWDGRDLKER